MNVTVDLQSIINNDIIDIKQVTEMQLSSFLPLKDLHRMQWNYTDSNGDVTLLHRDSQKNKYQRQKQAQSLNVVVNPRNIRTFVVNQDINH